MPSLSELQSLTEQLLPGLVREIGATQDEVKRASGRLGRVPPALLQDGSKLHLDKARYSLDAATEHMTKCLQKLHEQYPDPEKRDNL